MYLVLFLLVCFLAGLAASLLWLKLARVRLWFDIPNLRSSHTHPTPKGGGVGFAIVFSAVVLLLAWQDFLSGEYIWLLLPALCLSATGLLDDIQELHILPRIGLQSLAVISALWILPVMPPLILPWLGALPTPLTLVLLAVGWIWLINLYNFMDGIDGLAAGEAVFVSLALGWFAQGGGLHGDSLLWLAFGAILGGFLCSNWAPARLFMGDAGSNFLGFALVAYGLMLVLNGAVTIWTLLVLLAVFVADTTVTLFSRMRAGLVWYHGHRSHAYQLLALAHKSHARVVVGVTAINLLWLLPLAWLSTQYKEWGALLAFVALLPLLVTVSRCRARFLGGNMQ